MTLPPTEAKAALRDQVRARRRERDDHARADVEAQLAVRLGATTQQARALAETYAAAVYPQMSDAYRDRDCVEGGSLDRTPGDGLWP